ncbi:MAG TPA: hypothetical protein VNM92_12305 [Thermoanaerobaculia bacterium]|nr:hypothetical protein [Thermoanaerobaculia bacterium]
MKRLAPFGLILTLLSAVALSVHSETAPAKEGKQVVCALCGDYTFDVKHAVTGKYKGKHIHLCSLKELKLLEAKPDQYVWAIDVVSGQRVHKLDTPFTADRRVNVRKVKEKNRREIWPRRFFFESQKNRDEFLRNPARYLKEPYDV